MTLDEYKPKRDFSNTAEPSRNGRSHARSTRQPKQLYFCVQKHWVSQSQYGLRLWHHDVAVSRAVSKGLSLDSRTSTERSRPRIIHLTTATLGSLPGRAIVPVPSSSWTKALDS